MAEQREGMTVNRLPSLTWNRLGVNFAKIFDDEIPASDAEAAFSARNDDQVARGARATEEAQTFADSMSDGVRREAYVAAKRSIYQGQHFATGLGHDFTDYMNANVPETYVYTVEENDHPDKPIVLNWDFGKGAKALAQQVIHVKKNAEATFLMTYTSEKNAEGLGMFETRVILEEGATLHLMKVNLLGEGFVLADDSAAVVRDGAHFDYLSVMLGAARTYAGCYADQCGKGAMFTVDTGYMAEKDHLVDINYVAAQRGKKTQSKINVKGSLRDTAKKVFRGTIDFRKGTKGSTGDEQEDVLLLSPRVTNKTVPVILTEEEDVDGRHGATIGNLSEDILFYLETRGLDADAAEMLMTRGRLAGVAHRIPDQDTVDRIDAFIEEAFGNND
ncbi:MAG: SufD family Fe-S cluster assembly protein [Lachnospiraceae bacterium]|nr:SufD family Fe-S cluster assembly protein [Lachnospiraceae bacterium]